MQSRRDQVDAQSHLISRLTSALVRGEPDALEPPTRRDTRALASGVLVALIALAAVAGWALFSTRGSTKWQQPGTLILDKATGSRYLLVDDSLRPVLNIASARLLAGSSLKTASVPTSRLAKIPRGAPIGVPDGPDSLPQATLVSHGVWSACALPGSATGVLVDIGSEPSTDRVGADEGMLVAAGGQEYLLWRGMKLKLGADWVPDVLGFGSIEPTPVSTAWLDLVPAGTDLAPMSATGKGSAGPVMAGKPTKIGQLFTSDVGNAHFMMMKDGLAPLTATQYALAAAQPGRPAEGSLDPAALAAVGHGTAPAGANRLPVEPPVVRSPAAGVAPCLEYRPTGAAAAIDAAQLVRRPVGIATASVGTTTAQTGSSAGAPALGAADGSSSGVAGLSSLGSAGASSSAGAASSNSAASAKGSSSPSPDAGGGGVESRPTAIVRVTPGGGAVVVTRPGVAVGDQPSVLVDDTGTAYPLAGQALTALGYRAEQAVLIPAQWLALLPPGPLLSKG